MNNSINEQEVLKKLGMHPNTNTSTLYIFLENLVKVIKNHSNTIKYITI